LAANKVAVLDEAPDRLADRRPADTEPGTKQRLVGELGAGRELRGEDCPPESIADDIGEERAGREWPERHVARAGSPGSGTSAVSAVTTPAGTRPRRTSSPATTINPIVTDSSTVAIAFASGVTPRRIEAKR